MSLTQINKAGLDELALDHVFTIGASGSSAYTFQGEGLNGTVNNPTLYLTRGKTYRFENGSGGHPIRIQSTSGASGTAYNTGVTNNASAGTVIVEVQHDAPDVLYYQCTSHANMNGVLYITGALADGGVTTAKLANDAVTTAKIASDAVGSAEIANNAITTVKIAADAVTTTKIADSQITTAKINDQGVTSAKIASDAVHSGKIADDAVGTEHIQDQAITSPLIAPNAVVTAKIADDAVTNAKIADGAVGGNQLGSNAVTAAKIGANEVTSAAIAAGAVGTAKLSDQAVTLDKLPHGTSSNNGKFLRANNGADPTFETVSTDLVADTTPQLGGDLDTNGRNINFGHAGTHSDDTLRFGANGNDLYINHGGNANISCETGQLYIRNTGNFSSTRKVYIMGKVDEQSVTCESDGPVEIYHNNSKKFETTSYGTRVTGYQSSSTYVGFHVKGSLQDHGYGTNHGSGITSYDVSYYSPIPMFASKTIDHGSSYLTFPGYANGNYIKFTAPVSGLYQLELMASIETHHGGDWCAMGWEINTTTANSGNDLMNNGRGVLSTYERVNTDTGMGTHFSTTIYMAANDYAVLYQQSTQAVRWKGNQYFVRGHLIH